MLEDFLPLVAKPARYINSELNCVRKDLSAVKTKVCLFFPDTYEVGMSHLGLRILYHVLNSRLDTACERVFSPWTDYEEKLRGAGGTLTSLESNLPLARFDIIGITLQYELSYANILAGLDMAGIPVRSEDRNSGHPVIIAGGPCAVNPGPLSDFIDVFFIGEAEEAAHELVELKQRSRDKAGFLEALSKQESFYVPALGKKPVRRRFIKDLDSSAYPDKPLLPLMKPIHDRVTVEVARGCIHGCRFCQAGIIYRPYRERGAERIKALLDESLRCTGYDELSLASLSSGDYSEIGPLMRELSEKYREDRISVSLPSLRIGTLTPEMVRAAAGVRKTGFTLAPEAGTERLRRVINKPVSDADLMEAAETIFANGWNVLKLYFMIGLPTETEEDLDGIVRIAHSLLSLGKHATKRRLQLNITLSTFVPKPHTPFQWNGQAPIGEIRAKHAYLAQGLRRKGVTLKPHNPEMSVLEAAFARGDRTLGRVIEEAVRLGCRFDGWSECFDFAKWEEAFRACGMDAAQIACRAYTLDDELPWDHVRSGVTKEFLTREHRRAMAAEITDNCRAECGQCGIGCRDGGSSSLGKPGVPTAVPKRNEAVLPPRARRGSPGVHEPVARIRMKFTKIGRLRFISHLDLMQLFQRAVSRAGIPIAFSQGFNPHPKIAFGPALSVGMESEAEYLDMEINAPADLLLVTKALNATLPEGIRVLASRVISSKAPSLSGSIGKYDYEITLEPRYSEGIEDRVQDFLSRPSIVVVREEKTRELRPCIGSIRVAEGGGPAMLFITLVDQDQLKPRIQDVLEALFGNGPGNEPLFRIKRTEMFCAAGDRWLSPMEA